MDAWDIPGLRALGVDFDVAVLDIAQWSGRDSLLDSLSLTNSYWLGFDLRYIVCKSKALLQMGQRLLDAKLLDPGQKLQKLCLHSDKAAPAPSGPPAGPDPTSGKVVCAVGVLEYRATIPFVIRDGDRVLEIGCQAGLTAKLIKQSTSGRVVGSDVAPQSIEHAKRQGAGHDVEWAVLDGWDLHGIQALGPWDVIYMDISGISGRNCVQDGLALIFSYFRLLPELRTVVVKSRSLRDVSNRFVKLGQ